jgi:hypothetical protein
MLSTKSCPDYRQKDAAIKAAKEAKVKRVLQVETDLAEDPDALLEVDEEAFEKPKSRRKSQRSLERHIELDF